MLNFIRWEVLKLRSRWHKELNILKIHQEYGKKKVKELTEELNVQTKQNR